MSFIAASSPSRIIRLVVVVVVILYCERCSCSQQVCSRSCGRVHNISHPFRLKDDPLECGDLRYNLTCEANQLMVYLGYLKGKYRVESINYNNFTIRLVDANLSQLRYFPIKTSYSLGLYNLSFNYDEPPYQIYLQSLYSGYHSLLSSMLCVSCPNGVDFSGGVHVDDGLACINSSSSSSSSSSSYGKSFYHVNATDKSLWDLGLGDSCRVEFMYLTSWHDHDDTNNISCTKIRDMLLYGFELSWANSHCKEGHFAELLNNNHWRCESGSLWSLFRDVWFLLTVDVFLEPRSISCY